MSNNPASSSMGTNSSLRHPLEQDSSSNPIANPPGPMILRVNDSSLPPPPYSSSSLLPLLNSVPVINRLPSIDATSLTGISTSGSIRSNSSSLRLSNALYNNKSSGMSNTGGLVTGSLSPTLNHRIHGSRNRRTNLQQQIQLQLHQQQLHMHLSAGNHNNDDDGDVQIEGRPRPRQQHLPKQTTTATSPPQQSQVGRSRHRHPSNDSSATSSSSSSDHSDISSVTDDETANSCCNFDCFKCRRSSKNRLPSSHSHHVSHRGGQSGRTGHASDTLNDHVPSVDESHHISAHGPSASDRGNLRSDNVPDDGHVIHFTSTDDDETAEGINRNVVDCRDTNYKSLGGCICCVPLFCCPSFCITNCNGQIITSYVLALIATGLVVSGVYCSLFFWNKLWLILSVIGIFVIILGTIIHYTGSKSLSRKLRNSSNGGLFKSLPRNRHRLRPISSTNGQLSGQLNHENSLNNQYQVNSFDAILHQPKNKSKSKNHRSNVHGQQSEAGRINNNVNQEHPSRGVSSSAVSPYEASASTSNVIYEELIDSQNYCKSSNCDDKSGQYQKIQRNKRSLSTHKHSQDDSVKVAPLLTKSGQHNRYEPDESSGIPAGTSSANDNSLNSPQIVNLNGQKYLILPIDNSRNTSVNHVTVTTDHSVDRSAPTGSSKINVSCLGNTHKQCNSFDEKEQDDRLIGVERGSVSHEQNVISRHCDGDDTGNDDTSNNYLLPPDIETISITDATGLQLIPLDLLCPSDASTITRKQSVTDFICKLDPSRLLSSQSCLLSPDLRSSKTQALLAEQINLMKQQQDNQNEMLCMINSECKNLSSLNVRSNENESLIHIFGENNCDDESLLQRTDDTSGEKGKKKFIKRSNQRKLVSGMDAIETSSNLRKKRSGKVKKSSKQVNLIGQLDSLASPDECLQTDQEDLSLISLPSTSTQSANCNSMDPSLSKGQSSASEDISPSPGKLTSVIASTDSSAVSTPIACSSMSSSYHESLTSSHSTNSGSLGDTCNLMVSQSIACVGKTTSREYTCNDSSPHVENGPRNGSPIENAPSALINIADDASSSDSSAHSVTRSSRDIASSSMVTAPLLDERSTSFVDSPCSLERIKINSGHESSTRQNNRHTISLPLVCHALDRPSNLTQCSTTSPQSSVRHDAHQQLTASMSTPASPEDALTLQITVNQMNLCTDSLAPALPGASGVTLVEAIRGDDGTDDTCDSDDSTASSSSFLFFIPPRNGRSPRFKRKKSSRSKTVTIGRSTCTAEASAPAVPSCLVNASTAAAAAAAAANDSLCTGSNLNNEFRKKSSLIPLASSSSLLSRNISSNCPNATASSSTQDKIVCSINQLNFENQIQDGLNPLTKSLAATCASKNINFTSDTSCTSSSTHGIVPTVDTSVDINFSEPADSSINCASSNSHRPSPPAPTSSSSSSSFSHLCISQLDTTTASPDLGGNSPNSCVISSDKKASLSDSSPTTGEMRKDCDECTSSARKSEQSNESAPVDEKTFRSHRHPRKKESSINRSMSRYATRTIDRLSEVDGPNWQSVSPLEAASNVAGDSHLSRAACSSLLAQESILSDERDILTSETNNALATSSGAHVINTGLLGVASKSGKTTSNNDHVTGGSSALTKRHHQPSEYSSLMANEVSSSLATLTAFSSSSEAGALNTPKSIANVTSDPHASSVTASNASTLSEATSPHDTRGKHCSSRQVDEAKLASARRSFFIAFPATQSTMHTTASLAKDGKIQPHITSNLTTHPSGTMSAATTPLNDHATAPDSIYFSSLGHAKHSPRSTIVNQSFTIDMPQETRDAAAASGSSLTRSDTFSKGSRKHHKKSKLEAAAETETRKEESARPTKNASHAQDVTRAPDKSTGAIPRRIKRQLTQTINITHDGRVDDASSRAEISASGPPNAPQAGQSSGSAYKKAREDVNAADINCSALSRIDKENHACSSSNFYSHVYEELYFTDVNSCNSRRNSKQKDNENQYKLLRSSLNHPSCTEDGIDRGLSDGDFGRLVNCDNSTDIAINSIQSPPPSYFDVIENSSLYQTLSQSELQKHLTNSTIKSDSSSAAKK